MLSVVNRGTVTGSDVDGIPFRVIDGYTQSRYAIKLNNIDSPLVVNLPATVKQGYVQESVPIISAQSIMSVNLQPIIKSGYTPKTVNPQER
jgi:hypothetical protein